MRFCVSVPWQVTARDQSLTLRPGNLSAPPVSQTFMYGYFDILTLKPARNLLERLRKKNWNYKSPFTYILRHFGAYNPKSISKFMKNGLNSMLTHVG